MHNNSNSSIVCNNSINSEETKTVRDTRKKNAKKKKAEHKETFYQNKSKIKKHPASSSITYIVFMCVSVPSYTE